MIWQDFVALYDVPMIMQKSQVRAQKYRSTHVGQNKKFKMLKKVIIFDLIFWDENLENFYKNLGNFVEKGFLGK